MEKITKLLLSICIGMAAMVAVAQAQYSQNFDTYLGTAATVPVGWTVALTGSLTFQGVGNGTTGPGGAWAYGTGGENSFGALPLGSGDVTLAGNFINNTGATITNLTIGFTYEQWRYFGTNGFDLSGTGALTGNAMVNAADFTGNASGTNGTPQFTPITLNLTGLSIANGATFGLSWFAANPTGGTNGMSIDGFSLSSGTVVPEPSTYAMIFVGTGLLFWMQRRRRKAS